MTPTIIVFGTTGMLGSVVYDHLASNPDFDVYGTSRQSGGPRIISFDANLPILNQLERLPAATGQTYWINCIGIIKPHCKDQDGPGVRNALRVNGMFPHELAAAAQARGARLMQIATDCVYSGAKGNYVETDPHDALDVYGKTKSLGEVFDKQTLNLRVSIIGPERKSHLSLLDWFLAQPSRAELKGFTHHRWNGISTLRFAMLCEAIIRQNQFDSLIYQSHVHHYVPADSVNKFELLEIFQAVFKTDYHIHPVGNVGPDVDRTLSTNYSALTSILPSVPVSRDIESLGEYLLRLKAGR
jgi:dTDP-4-dehydrorhamnose reductase